MIVACVRTGTKYPVEYVYKLRDMVRRHLPIPHEFRCLSDQLMMDYTVEDITNYHLQGWWGKMALFEPQWRQGQRVLYFDLDTVVCGDLTPLAELDVDFGICANFTRAAGHKTWPCGYGSCVMTIGPDKCEDIWRKFHADDLTLMRKAGGYGDQKVIEQLAPAATLLQDVLPTGFFLGYRDLDYHKPDHCSVVCFAGSSKPNNCNKEWIGREWVLSS